MAVVSTINQIFLPGLEGVVVDNLNSVLATNGTIDSINTNLETGGNLVEVSDALTSARAALATLPSMNALPTFATYSSVNNASYWNIYSSNMALADAGYTYNDSEFYSGYSSYYNTNSRINTSGFSTERWMAATPAQQADGHSFLNLHAGNNTYPFKHPSYGAAAYPFFGVVIGERGVRQPISIASSNAVLKIAPRGTFSGSLESVTLSSSTYATWFGGTTYGNVGYNDRTKTLVVVEAKDTSNNYRMHIWKNTGRSLNQKSYKTGTLYSFLSEAKSGLSPIGAIATYSYYDFQWLGNSSQAYSESQYRMRVVPGDNGIVGMARMVPSNGSYYATYNPSSQTLSTSFNSISATTSYGFEQGQNYGMRHNISWDNNWVAAYAPYYYYGGGMNNFFIDTRDPRNYYTSQNSSTSGCQLIPYKESSFLFNSSDNVDNAIGMYLYIVNPEGAKQTGRHYSTTISNGAVLPLQGPANLYTFDTKYTSTNYPVLISMPHWKITQ